jgi:hypothetical protein
MLHSTPITIHGKVNHQVGDCATGFDSTSGGVANGSVVDRYQLPGAFTHVQPFIIGTYGGTTSTTGGRWRSVLAKVRHGDSSGGGDLADFNTAPSAQVYFTTGGESTDYKQWTTGVVRVGYSPVPQPLLGAKRFVAVGFAVTGPGAATSTTAIQGISNVAAGLTFLRADQEKPSMLGVIPGGASYKFSTASSTL